MLSNKSNIMARLKLVARHSGFMLLTYACDRAPFNRVNRVAGVKRRSALRLLHRPLADGAERKRPADSNL